MALIDDTTEMARSIGAEIKEKKGARSLRLTVAERKAFLSRKKLEYIARFRIDEAAGEVRFTEMLKESGSGVSGGIEDPTPGFGFKKETYRTGKGPREGTIVEQSRYFGEEYDYSFDWSAVRSWMEQAAAAYGYRFTYSVTGEGI